MSYHAVVDMGSNGIRFSIYDLHPLKALALVSPYSERIALSLYDAQYSVNNVKVAIPNETMQQVLQNFERLGRICQDFMIGPERIHLICTEATR